MNIDETGQRAKSLLDDTVLTEAFTKIEERTVLAWRNAKTAEEREHHWAVMNAIELVRSELRTHVQDLEVEIELRKRRKAGEGRTH